MRALNFVRCSKCCDMSVASTMSMIEVLISLYVALKEREREGGGGGIQSHYEPHYER